MMEDRVRGKFQVTVHCKDWWTLLQFTGWIGGLCSDGGQGLWKVPRQLTGWIRGLCHNGVQSTWQVPDPVRIGGLCHNGVQSTWQVPNLL